jgi:hypothetical protein
MYEVLCERCWHTEAVEGEELPAHACPKCRTDGTWVGPFAQAPQRFSRRDSWPVLTSPLYQHAGHTERRTRQR